MAGCCPIGLSNSCHMSDGLDPHSSRYLSSNLRDALGWSRPIAEARLISKSPESTDNAHAVHSLDSPATLPVESGLPVRFGSLQ